MRNILLIFNLIVLMFVLTSGNPYVNQYNLNYIENSDNIGKIYSPSIDNLRFRENQTLKSKIIRNLKKGEKLTLLIEGKEEEIGGDRGRWIKVRTSKNEKGWCFNAYLKYEGMKERKNNNKITVQSELLGAEFSYPAEWGTFYSILWEVDKETSTEGPDDDSFIYAFFISNEKVSYKSLKNFCAYLPRKTKISGGGGVHFGYSFEGFKKDHNFDCFFDGKYYKYFDKKIIDKHKASAFFVMKYEDRFPPRPSPTLFYIEKLYLIDLPDNKKIKGIMLRLNFLSDEQQEEIEKLAKFDWDEYRNMDKLNDDNLKAYNQKLDEIKEQIENGSLSENEKKIIAEYDEFVKSIKIIK